MSLLLILLAIFVSAYIIHLIWRLCEVSGWSDEQSQRMLEELEQNGEELREKYANDRR